MIVVDASAALSALLNDGPARHALAGEPVHVPHLIDVEIASALRSGTLAGHLEPAAAWSALERWRRLGLTRHCASALLDRVWALRANLSAYDACYVALAETLGCPLLTADGRLGRAPGVECTVTVVPR